jgi:hypothetical protein
VFVQTEAVAVFGWLIVAGRPVRAIEGVRLLTTLSALAIGCLNNLIEAITNK